jgi:competence protein ComEC
LNNWPKIFKFKNIFFAFLCVVLLSCSLARFCQTNFNLASENLGSECEFSVYFFDVGKADCALIKSKNHAVLIDAADKNSKQSIKDNLRKLGIKTIDLFVLTHPHSDHYGQTVDILKNFKVKCFATSKSRIETSVKRDYKKIMKELKKNKINKKLVKSGDLIEIDDIKIQILGPTKEYFNINNNSVVSRIIYKEHSFLFTGDAEKESEKDIIEWCKKNNQELKSNIIKIGHHGSNTSTSWNFLSSVKPKFAIISTSEDKFKLTKKVRSRLKEANVKTISTNSSGTAVICVNKDEIKINNLLS